MRWALFVCLDQRTWVLSGVDSTYPPTPTQTVLASLTPPPPQGTPQSPAVDPGARSIRWPFSGQAWGLSVLPFPRNPLPCGFVVGVLRPAPVPGLPHPQPPGGLGRGAGPHCPLWKGGRQQQHTGSSVGWPWVPHAGLCLSAAPCRLQAQVLPTCPALRPQPTWCPCPWGRGFLLRPRWHSDD